MNWQTILSGAGAVIVEVASSFGPIPGAVASFAVSAVTAVVTAAEAKQDPVKTIEALEDQVAELLAALKAQAG